MAEEVEARARQVAERSYKLVGDRAGPRAWLEYGLARGVLGGAARLPRVPQEALIEVLARVARRVDRRHSEAARRFLRQALGEARSAAEDEERVVQAWRHLLRVILNAESFDRHVPRERLLEHYEVERCAGMSELLASGSGGIVVTPHLGDWEAGSAVLPALGFAPFYAVFRPPRNRPLSEHVLRVRAARGVRLLPRRGGMARIAELLRAGAWIGLLMDQRPMGKHLIAPFFGRPALCERSAEALSRRLRAPIVIGACFMTERPFHYRAVFQRVLRPEELEDASPEQITALINAEMERLVLRHPEQYHWLHDRYRWAPEPAPDA